MNSTNDRKKFTQITEKYCKLMKAMVQYNIEINLFVCLKKYKNKRGGKNDVACYER